MPMAYHGIFLAADNNMACVLLTLIGLCNLLVTTETVNDDRCNIGNGIIVPEEPYFLEHEDVVLECFAHQVSKKLAFLIGKDTRPVDRLCNRTGVSDTTVNPHGMEIYPVASTCIWERNATYIKLVIPRVTALDVKEYKLGMHVKCIDAGIEPYTCINNTYIQLEYFPIEPENITCIANNFETLFCSWDLGPVYKFPRKTTIACQYVFNVSTKFNILPERAVNAWAICPNGTSTSCFWDASQYHNSLKILLNVSVTNLVRKITVSKNVTVIRDDVLKPAKVENLTIQHIEDATCIHVWWKPPFIYKKYTKYNISYSSQCQSTEKVIQFYCDELYYCDYRLCDLNPFTVYNLSVSSRYCPEKNETGYWSEPTWTVFTTDRAIPNAAPLVTDGLYLYDGKHLTLYWQPLEACDMFSDDTVYEISISGITKSYSVTDYVMETLVRNGNITSSQSFDVKIVTKNIEGTADKGVGLKIFSESFGLKDSELIIEYRRNATECKEYLASIRVDASNFKEFPIITHTIVWCNTTAGACIDPMHWWENVTVASKLPLPIQECNETYRFWLITKAYHMLTKKMVWSGLNAVHCEFMFDTVPKEPLPKVKLSKVMLPNTVTVEWEHYPCNKPHPYIENYIITYCEARPPQSNETCDCLKKRQEVSVPNKNASYTIKDLDSNLELCVWVSPNSSAGRGPKNRNILFCTVKPGEGNGVAVVITLIFSLLFGIMMITITVVICWRRFKSRMNEAGRIEDPFVDNRVEDNREYDALLVAPNYEEIPIDQNDEHPPTPYEESSNTDSGNEGMYGYARPQSIMYSSHNSLNSELTQNGGNEVYIDTLDGQFVRHNESNDFDETDDQAVDSQLSLKRSETSDNGVNDWFKKALSKTNLSLESRISQEDVTPSLQKANTSNSLKDDTQSFQKDGTSRSVKDKTPYIQRDGFSSMQKNFSQCSEKDNTSNSQDDIGPNWNNDNAPSNQNDISSNMPTNFTQTCRQDSSQNLHEDDSCQHLSFNHAKMDETKIKERQCNNINCEPIEEVQPRLDKFKTNSAYTDSLGTSYSLCASYNAGVIGNCETNYTSPNLAGYSTYGDVPEKDGLSPTYSTSVLVKPLSEKCEHIDQNHSKLGMEPKPLSDISQEGRELCNSNTLQLEQPAEDKVLASKHGEKHSLLIIKPSLGTVTSAKSSTVPEKGGCQPITDPTVTQSEKVMENFKCNGSVDLQVMTNDIAHKIEEQSTSATTGTSNESKSSGSLPDYICADNNAIPQG